MSGASVASIRGHVYERADLLPENLEMRSEQRDRAWNIARKNPEWLCFPNVNTHELVQREILC